MTRQRTQYIEEGSALTFEAEFARLRVRVETACSGEAGWPARAAAGVRACFAFAIEHPPAARLLTFGSLAGGAASRRRYERMISHFADLLRAGRELDCCSPGLPAITESAMAGSVALLIGRRLDQGLEEELSLVAAEAVEFVLIPYVGIEEARRLALDQAAAREL